VTDTITASKTRICPVPLSSVMHERPVAPTHSSGLLPKWARSHPSLEQASMQSSTVPSVPCDSKVSFGWAPERVSVPSWHRTLSEKYTGYNMVNLIGEGRHGAVFIVQHRLSEKYYACKLLRKRDHEPNALRGEIEALRCLDHPNIVRLCETNEDAESVSLLMELCHGGDLFGRISEEGSLPEHVARAFAEQMLGALAYCHAVGVAHHDIKPENFLLETEDPRCLSLKLADFGIATGIRPEKLDSTVGSRTEVKGSIPYMAPERLLRRWDSLVKDLHESGHSLAPGDLWSCGVVVYVMLSGDLPFGESIDAICSGLPPDFSGEVWRDITAEATDLIMRLLNPQVQSRWTAKQALGHPWFSAGVEPPLPSDCHVEDARLVNATERHELARTLVRSLRRWRRFAKLKRIAIAAIAKRLEADHPSLRLAQAGYHAFNTKRDKLRCEELVHALNDALCEAMSTPAAAPQDRESQPLDLLDGDTSSGSTGDGCSSSAPHTLTGLHVRRAVKGLVRHLSKRLEETPQASPPSESPGIMSVCSEDLVSLTELKCLVEALDGVRNGTVDFTLLVAALLPPEVFCDEVRIVEVFDMFDFRKCGGITAADLLTYMRTAMSSKDASIRRFSEMVAEFDLNDDGRLDLEEFRSMLRGSRSGGDTATRGATPMTF